MNSEEEAPDWDAQGSIEREHASSIEEAPARIEAPRVSSEWGWDGKRVAIHGNTLPVRSELRALGGTWDRDLQVWWVPKERAGEARDLVRRTEKLPWPPANCRACGKLGDDRHPIFRSGECRQCFQDRRGH